MIRFIDLTKEYWSDKGPPCCAFLNTIDDKFILARNHTHVFDYFDDVYYHNLSKRLLPLLPKDFFDENTKVS